MTASIGSTGCDYCDDFGNNATKNIDFASTASVLDPKRPVEPVQSVFLTSAGDFPSLENLPKRCFSANIPWQRAQTIRTMNGYAFPSQRILYRIVIPMREITSSQNPRIKQTLRLRNRRGRAQQERIIVDGLREILRALTGGVRPVDLFVCQSLLDPIVLRELDAGVRQFGIRPTDVPESLLEKLAFGSRAEGAVLVAQTPSLSLEQLAIPDNGLVAVLESVEKPGNLGAVLRTADAVGLAAVLVADPRTDLFNPNTIRASLGAVFHVPVAAASNQEILTWLRQRSLAILATRVEGAVDYTKIDYRRPAAIVLGNEAEGLSDFWTGPDITAITLPMCGVVDSLNVSVSASIVFYEALRQRRLQTLDPD